MPLVLQKFIQADTILAIWKIEEPAEVLMHKLNNNFFEPEHNSRIKQANALHYLASRAILTSLFPEVNIALNKDVYNKPYLKLNQKNYNISISHSNNYATILVSKDWSVAIDIEKIDERIGRVKHKFLNETELVFAGQNTQILEQTLIWSAKETMYKLYGLKELDFRANLSLEPFIVSQTGKILGNIHKNEVQKKIQISYFEFDNFFISYTLEPNSQS